MNLHQTRRPCAFARATACSTCGSVIPFRLARSTSGFPDSTPTSSVSKFAPPAADELGVDPVDPGLGREPTRRWNPPEMIPSRIAFVRPMSSPNVSSSIRIRGPVALQDLVDLLEHVARRSVPGREARVVGAEDAPKRAAAVCDQREGVDRGKEIPGRERQQVVVVGRETRAPDHLAPPAGDEPGDPRWIDPPFERRGELAGESIPFADAGEVERRAFLQRLPPDGVDVGAAHDDRDVRSAALDPPRHLDARGTRPSCR